MEKGGGVRMAKTKTSTAVKQRYKITSADGENCFELLEAGVI